MGLVPFVQAVVAAFGTKLADAIDDRTRRAVRRLLRRTHQPPAVPGDPERIQVSVSLNSDTGVRVLLDDDLPAEAVAQLVRIATAGPAVSDGVVLWHPKASLDGHWYVESDGRFTAVWDSDARDWRSPAG
jgi:hypothetical protein